MRPTSRVPQSLGYASGCPTNVAGHQSSEQLLTIPTHPLVSENNQKKIYELFNGVLREPSADHAMKVMVPKT